MFTDGLVERRGEGLDRGLDRLRIMAGRFTDQDPSSICDAIIRSMADGDGYDDDAVILVARYVPQTVASRPVQPTS